MSSSLTFRPPTMVLSPSVTDSGSSSSNSSNSAASSFTEDSSAPPSPFLPKVDDLDAQPIEALTWSPRPLTLPAFYNMMLLATGLYEVSPPFQHAPSMVLGALRCYYQGFSLTWPKRKALFDLGRSKNEFIAQWRSSFKIQNPGFDLATQATTIAFLFSDDNSNPAENESVYSSNDAAATSDDDEDDEADARARARFAYLTGRSPAQLPSSDPAALWVPASPLFLFTDTPSTSSTSPAESPSSSKDSIPQSPSIPASSSFSLPLPRVPSRSVSGLYQATLETIPEEKDLSFCDSPTVILTANSPLTPISLGILATPILATSSSSDSLPFLLQTVSTDSDAASLSPTFSFLLVDGPVPEDLQMARSTSSSRRRRTRALLRHAFLRLRSSIRRTSRKLKGSSK